MKIVSKVCAGLSLLSVAGMSQAAALDFSSITGAVDGATVVTALGVIAGVLMLPRAARWGYRQVMSMVR